MTTDEAEKKADEVIALMQGGPICDVSPDRSRRIIASAMLVAVEAEREACASQATSLLQVGAETLRPKTPEEIAILIRARGTP